MQRLRAMAGYLPYLGIAVAYAGYVWSMARAGTASAADDRPPDSDPCVVEIRRRPAAGGVTTARPLRPVSRAARRG